MTNDLNRVPAGAGSGKTHRIKQELAGLVERAKSAQAGFWPSPSPKAPPPNYVVVSGAS